MRIAEFVGLLGGRSRRFAEIAINCAVAYLLILLAWYGWVIAAGNMDQLSSVLYYPMGVQYAALPVGSAIALVYILRDILLLGSGELLHDDVEI
jgi:TRAP-type C4-dicarboxylate transport system permease small subunit